MWLADVRFDTTIGLQTVSVPADGIEGARQMIMRTYHVNRNQIFNVRQEKVNHNSPQQFSPSSGNPIAGFGAASFIVVAVLFAMFTPWVLMVLGGMIGTKAGELFSGFRASELDNPDDDQQLAAFYKIVLPALALGASGFIAGQAIQTKYFSDTPQQQPVEHVAQPKAK
jgi:hypothetical protein